MYNYQTKILIEKNYDFSQVKPDKQKQLTESSGYDFSLVDVVSYLKKQSKDFTEETDLLKDIDETIKNIVISHHSDTQTPNPFGEPSGEKKEPTKEDVLSAIDGLKIMYDLEPDNEAYKEAIEGLELYLETMP
jgi:hypothetical protein